MTQVAPAAASLACAVANNWIQWALDMKMANPSRQNHKKLDHRDRHTILCRLCLQDMRETRKNAPKTVQLQSERATFILTIFVCRLGTSEAFTGYCI